MHKLQNCEQAIVAEDKILLYLLNYKHSEGKHKAKFFHKLGYSKMNYVDFQKEILRMACSGVVIKMEKRSPYGLRITMRATLFSPISDECEVIVGWFYDNNEALIPRLITIYPA